MRAFIATLVIWLFVVSSFITGLFGTSAALMALGMCGIIPATFALGYTFASAGIRLTLSTAQPSRTAPVKPTPAQRTALQERMRQKRTG